MLRGPLAATNIVPNQSTSEHGLTSPKQWLNRPNGRAHAEFGRVRTKFGRLRTNIDQTESRAWRAPGLSASHSLPWSDRNRPYVSRSWPRFGQVWAMSTARVRILQSGQRTKLLQKKEVSTFFVEYTPKWGPIQTNVGGTEPKGGRTCVRARRHVPNFGRTHPISAQTNPNVAEPTASFRSQPKCVRTPGQHAFAHPTQCRSDLAPLGSNATRIWSIPAMQPPLGRLRPTSRQTWANFG